MNHQHKAFHWIIGVLRNHAVKFVVSGGLAACSYGATRPLYDFDFDVEADGLAKILPDVAAYRVSGPQHHRSEVFANTLLELDYHGQHIDLAGAEDAELYDRAKTLWVPDRTDLDRFEIREVFGEMVPVIDPRDLLAYKQKIQRPEDLIDIQAIQRYLVKR